MQIFPLWPRAGQGHVLAAAFGVLMLGFTVLSLLMSQVKLLLDPKDAR